MERVTPRHLDPPHAGTLHRPCSQSPPPIPLPSPAPSAAGTCGWLRNRCTLLGSRERGCAVPPRPARPARHDGPSGRTGRGACRGHANTGLAPSGHAHPQAPSRTSASAGHTGLAPSVAPVGVAPRCSGERHRRARPMGRGQCGLPTRSSLRALGGGHGPMGPVPCWHGRGTRRGLFSRSAHRAGRVSRGEAAQRSPALASRAMYSGSGASRKCLQRKVQERATGSAGGSGCTGDAVCPRAADRGAWVSPSP